MPSGWAYGELGSTLWSITTPEGIKYVKAPPPEDALPHQYLTQTVVVGSNARQGVTTVDSTEYIARHGLLDTHPAGGVKCWQGPPMPSWYVWNEYDVLRKGVEGFTWQ
jgi:hypothetical protein